MKQLKVLGLKKQKVMFLLPSQYLHSKDSKLKPGGFKKTALEAHMLAIQKSHHQIFGTVSHHSALQIYLKLKEKDVQNFVLYELF